MPAYFLANAASLFLGIGAYRYLHAVLPTGGILVPADAPLCVSVLMRISPAPCYLRVICNRHPEWFLLVLVYFVLSGLFHSRSRLFLRFLCLPTCTEYYTTLTITYPFTCCIQSHFTQPLFPILTPCCPLKSVQLASNSPQTPTSVTSHAQKFKGGTL